MELPFKVSFLCKSCGGTFAKMDQFMNHKKEKHLLEFQKIKCILFEESVTFFTNIDGFNTSITSSSLTYNKQEQDLVQPFDTRELKDSEFDFELHSNAQPNLDLYLGSVSSEHNDNDSDMSFKKQQHKRQDQDDGDGDDSSINSFESDPDGGFYPSSDNDEDNNPQSKSSQISGKNDSHQNRKRNSLWNGSKSPNLTKKGKELNLKDWLNNQGQSQNQTSVPQIETKTELHTNSIILLNPDPRKVEVGRITDVNPISCMLCCKKLTTESQVKFHVQNCWLYNKQRHHYCTICHKSFQLPRLLRNHHAISHGTKQEKSKRYKYRCEYPMCHKKFLTFRQLNFHMQTHRISTEEDNQQQQNPTSLMCEFCGKSFKLHYHLSRHHVIHSQQKLFKCSHLNCAILFKSANDLLSHEIVHSDARPFKCLRRDCSKTFKNKRNARLHHVVHRLRKQYKCPMDPCDKTFSTFHILKLHMKCKHNVIKGQKQAAKELANPPLQVSLGCPYEECSAVFENMDYLRQHERVRHPQDPVPHILHVNLSQNREKSGLGSGSGSGVISKPCVCLLCGKSFRLMHYLTRHMATHFDERPFECSNPGCDRSFKTKTGLQIHQKTHTAVKEFKCLEPNCAKTFSVRKYMKQHFDTVHQGYRPYQCSQEGCDKKFVNSNSFKIHMKAKHGVENILSNFTCSVCNLIFKSKGLLESHTLVHSGGVTILTVE